MKLKTAQFRRFLDDETLVTSFKEDSHRDN